MSQMESKGSKIWTHGKKERKKERKKQESGNQCNANDLYRLIWYVITQLN